MHDQKVNRTILKLFKILQKLTLISASTLLAQSLVSQYLKKTKYLTAASVNSSLL